MTLSHLSLYGAAPACDWNCDPKPWIDFSDSTVSCQEFGCTWIDRSTITDKDDDYYPYEQNGDHPTREDDDDDGIGVGVIVGIVVGAIVIIAVIAAYIFPVVSSTVETTKPKKQAVADVADGSGSAVVKAPTEQAGRKSKILLVVETIQALLL